MILTNRNELFLLFFPHKYNNSLAAMSLEQCLACEKEIESLPPVFESSWESYRKPALHSVVAMACGLTSLYLHYSIKLKLIQLDDSIHSRFTTSCTVMVCHPSHPNELHLAKIE